MPDPTPYPMTDSRGLPIEHAVDQPGHRPHPRLVPFPPVPVHRAERLVAPQPADRVLHPDPPPRERPVVPPVPAGLSRPRGLRLGVAPRSRFTSPSMPT